MRRRRVPCRRGRGRPGDLVRPRLPSAPPLRTRARRPSSSRRPARRSRHGRQLEPALGGRLARRRPGGRRRRRRHAAWLCVGRTSVPAVCADNSSSATLDVPAGARIVAARLYVDTTLCVVGSTDPGAPRRPRRRGLLRRADERHRQAPPEAHARAPAASAPMASPLRQAVWDVTDYVGRPAAGAYTVADIVFERAGAFLPYASWAIVAAYELDPAADVAVMTPEQQARFAPRSITWFDGFVVDRQRHHRGARRRVRGPGRRSRCSARRSTSSPTPSIGAPTTCCSPVSRSATTCRRATRRRRSA